ncbi:large-conductance mechanosensitive channel protein MscL [Georgenia halophila]|uniref:Large-conductance mechanosensitive channel n=1 Tax=Georgenia halophila TaxID=620889 RepID=A0ABP8L2Z1_9MICO
MVTGFKEFVSRGNAVDLAVGLVIGVAFGQIVTALVDNVINPLVAGLFGEPNFDRLWVITVGGAGEPAQMLPLSVLTALTNFLLVALAVYLFVVVPMNKLAERRKSGEAEAPAAPAEDVLVLTEIRDLLAAQSGRGTPSQS